MDRGPEKTSGEINISRIPVNGIGGLGLIAIAGIVAYFLPPIRTAGVPALLGGVVIGVSLVAMRNRQTRPWAITGAVAAAVAFIVLVSRIVSGS